MSISNYRERKRREALDAMAAEAARLSESNAASMASATDGIAADNYPQGSLLMAGGTLVRATQAIARGERITSHNTEPTTLAGELARLEAQDA